MDSETVAQLEKIERTLREREGEIPWRRMTFQRALKRGVDFGAAAILLVLTSPLILLTAILVRVTSAGPLLLAQERVGLNGTLFRMYKFRSMVAETAKGFASNTGEVTATDARLTPVGGFIRAWRLDELPQLWHVLTGEMSLVGPRPDMPRTLHLYTEEQLLRFGMPPGCTAWTFTRGAFANDWRARQQINVEYVRQWTFWLDVQIMFGSAWILLKQENTTPKSEALFHSTEHVKGEPVRGSEQS